VIRGFTGARIRVALLILTLLVTGCQANAASPVHHATSSGSTGQAALAAHVSIRNHTGNDEFVYSPKTLTIHAGTRVVWTNVSSQPHTVTGTGNHPAFDSGTAKLVRPGKSYSHLFPHTGRYTYYCLLHPYMRATIVVTR
jgi:plastocyanin